MKRKCNICNKVENINQYVVVNDEFLIYLGYEKNDNIDVCNSCIDSVMGYLRISKIYSK